MSSVPIVSSPLNIQPVYDVTPFRGAVAIGTGLTARVLEGVGAQALTSVHSIGAVYDAEETLLNSQQIGPNLKSVLAVGAPAVALMAQPLAYWAGSMKGLYGGLNTVLNNDGAFSQALDGVLNDLRLVNNTVPQAGKFLMPVVLADAAGENAEAGTVTDITLDRALIDAPVTALLSGALTGGLGALMTIARAPQIAWNLLMAEWGQKDVGLITKLANSAGVLLGAIPTTAALSWATGVFGFARGLRDSYTEGFFPAMTHVAQQLDIYNEVSKLAVEASAEYAASGDEDRVRHLVAQRVAERDLNERVRAACGSKAHGVLAAYED